MADRWDPAYLAKPRSYIEHLTSRIENFDRMLYVGKVPIADLTGHYAKLAAFVFPPCRHEPFFN